jgi:lipopolysaccharide transport system permease protein
VSIVPARWQWLLQLNPMTGLIQGFRSALLGRPFDWMSLLMSGLIAVIALGIGTIYFRSTERDFADVV